MVDRLESLSYNNLWCKVLRIAMANCAPVRISGPARFPLRETPARESIPMTERERFRRIVHHQEVDRLPYMFGGPRAATCDAWHKQGLSE